MLRRSSRVALFVSAVFIISVPYSSYAASFDCAKAGTKIEKLICGNEKLSGLDSELANTYKKTKNSLDREAFSQIKVSQRKWLKGRNKACSSLNRCINIYTHRIQILETISDWNSAHNELTPNQLYRRFNMRSIFSSYGQRLKYYCESYPFEYFSENQMKIEGKDTLVLDNGNDYWHLKIADGKISLTNQITSGTYLSSEDYGIKYFTDSRDWRASETYIKKDKDCPVYLVD